MNIIHTFKKCNQRTESREQTNITINYNFSPFIDKNFENFNYLIPSPAANRPP